MWLDSLVIERWTYGREVACFNLTDYRYAVEYGSRRATDTLVPLIPSSIIWYNFNWSVILPSRGKVTIGLALHWPCVTYRLCGLCHLRAQRPKTRRWVPMSVPLVQHSVVGNQAFSVGGPQVWNCLPPEVTSAPWRPSTLDPRRFYSLSHILKFGLSDVYSTHCL